MYHILLCVNYSPIPTLKHAKVTTQGKINVTTWANQIAIFHIKGLQVYAV